MLGWSKHLLLAISRWKRLIWPGSATTSGSATKISLAGIARVTNVSQKWLQDYVNDKYEKTPSAGWQK
jgi:hypothetical protein